MDITDRKRAEQALRESEQRFRLMADSAPVLMWLSGPDSRRIDFNKEWLSFKGRSHVQEVGEGWMENIHPDDKQRCKNRCAKAFEQRESIRMEYRLRRHDGQYRWVLDHGVPRFLNDGTFAGYIGCCIDISDQKEAENARMLMTGRLINAQEEERARIARELHDDINQRMALLANGFRQLNQSISQNRAGLAESQRLFQLTTEISTAVQELSHQLHSSKLEYLGLAAAVRSLCHDFSATHNIEVDCSVRDLPSNLEYHVTLNIFRCIQEALRNVGKHSKAKHAKVELTGGADVVRLRVSDDGIGFDPNDPVNHSGLGLVSMGERLKWVGGEFSIWSKPSVGTQVEGSVPIAANKDHAAASLAS
jgi:PAS domain S-box-containing protein